MSIYTKYIIKKHIIFSFKFCKNYLIFYYKINVKYIFIYICISINAKTHITGTSEGLSYKD